jgi:hypothetical protein
MQLLQYATFLTGYLKIPLERDRGLKENFANQSRV